MANEWIQSDVSACYLGPDPGYEIAQSGILEIGKMSVVNFTVTNTTQGKLRLESMPGKPEYTEDGTYQVIGEPIQESLSFTAQEHLGLIFDGCITGISSYVIPYWTIKDMVGNTVLELTDDTGVTTHQGIIQYILNWEEMPEGSYNIFFNDGIVEYQSYCVCVKLDTCKNLVLSWSNDSNAYGFDYETLNFEPQVRVIGKLWKPKYPKTKEAFVDNAGNSTIISARTRKAFLLQLERLPEYIHDAINIGLDHDHFYVNGEELVDEDGDYEPDWKNESNLAKAEKTLYPKRQNLMNTRCGGTLE